ncbi:hypothetical protein DEU56DRAFT_841631 [Suillus clintonianus]|uniref:uncharacterized protein n=1 Tax=Suillus clintonianus TaxID=1904413 RepID=UPI001B872662|nr:uncharacterized protein DEU56DRAFT_841631 [Suillus clintonianus]KAG2114859.1 hypothetical protein DEU56DRAFT_841631 [Suillus clintonianus]
MFLLSIFHCVLRRYNRAFAEHCMGTGNEFDRGSTPRVWCAGSVPLDSPWRSYMCILCLLMTGRDNDRGCLASVSVATMVFCEDESELEDECLDGSEPLVLAHLRAADPYSDISER